MNLRERINGDPKLQIGLGAVLIVVVAFLLLHKGGGEEAEAVTEEPTAASVEPAATEEVTAPESTGTLADFNLDSAGPPLPHKVIAAYDADKTVAVLFVHDAGVDDRLVKGYTRSLQHNLSRSAFELFVVPVQKIGRYASLTLGLHVQRVPALIVLRRKKLSKGGLEGSLLYGYQAPARILQTVRNASYAGPPGSYHPG